MVAEEPKQRSVDGPRRHPQRRTLSGPHVVVVPPRIVHLVPFVGTHDHDVVAIGNVCDQLSLGDHDRKVLVIAQRRFDHFKPVFKARDFHLGFAQGTHR